MFNLDPMHDGNMSGAATAPAGSDGPQLVPGGRGGAQTDVPAASSAPGAASGAACTALQLPDLDGSLYDVPASLVDQHQVTGLQWVWRAIRGMHRSGCRGGILGDDTGLGKTLITVALVSTLIHHGLAARILIVAPAGLVSVWVAEFSKWLSHPPVSMLTVVGSD